MKTKGVEKRICQVDLKKLFLLEIYYLFIIKEHKKYENMSELDAKLKYTQLCRSLRTYGVTFFLVKVKKNTKKFYLRKFRFFFFFSFKGKNVGKK